MAPSPDVLEESEQEASTSNEGQEWLATLIADGTILTSTILGAVYTPKTRLAKGLPLVAIGETVFIKNGSAAASSIHATLLHRAGREDGRGETVAQIWETAEDPFIYVVFQRASGSTKYIEQEMVDADWEGSGQATAQVRIKSYEYYKCNKLWHKYGLGETLRGLAGKYPEKTIFFTGQSRGATMAEVAGFRYAVTARSDPNYRPPLIVSKGAYRWTNAAGRDLMSELLPNRFAHLLLSRVVHGTREYDFVSRVPSHAAGFVDMRPSFHIDVDLGAVGECVPSRGCPGTDVSFGEIWEATENYRQLHKSICYIHSLKKSMAFGSEACGDAGGSGGSTSPRCAGWQVWRPSACGYCMGVPIEDLVDENDGPPAALGCAVNMGVDETPECDIDSEESAQQVAGHIGTFYKLRGGGQVAKLMSPFDFDSCLGRCGSRQRASRAEWAFYMQTWCLRKLAARGHTGASGALLAPFALGEHPWAPRSYGACRVTDRGTGAHKNFLVLENVLAGFRKPTQVDLKVGYTTEPEGSGARDVAKRLFQNFYSNMMTTTGTHCVRAVGSKVWDPQAQAYTSPALSTLEAAFAGVLGAASKDVVAELVLGADMHLDAQEVNDDGKKMIYVYHKGEKNVVGWYNEMKGADIKEAILCACDAIIDGGFVLREVQMSGDDESTAEPKENGRIFEFESFDQLENEQTYIIEAAKEREDLKNITGDRWRRLKVQVDPLLHVEAIKAIDRMRRGSNLLKHTHYGFPHLRQFQLSDDRKRLIWYSGAKQKDDSVIQLDEVAEIRLGQTTPVFLHYRLPMLEHLSFSLVYGPKGSKTLDLTCKDEFEFDHWVTGLKAVLYHFKNREISKEELLGHSKRFRKALEKNNVAIKLTKLPEVKEKGHVGLDDCIEIVTHTPAQLETKMTKLRERLKTMSQQVARLDHHAAAEMEVDLSLLTGQGPAYASVFVQDEDAQDEEMEIRRMHELVEQTTQLLQQAQNELHGLKEKQKSEGAGSDPAKAKKKGNAACKHIDQLLWKAEVDLENVEDMYLRHVDNQKDTATAFSVSIAEMNQRITQKVDEIKAFFS